MNKDYMNGTIENAAILSNVKELRIGNVISIDGRPIKVTSSVLKKIEGLKRLSGYGAIPITWQILHNCGFFVPDGYPNKTMCRGDVLLSYDQSEDCWKLSLSWAYSPFIKSLHQLQNLYFALTGKEIEVSI